MMRIGAPKPPTTPPLPPARTGPSGAVGSAERPFAEQLTGGAAAPDRPVAARGAGSELASIAARLRSGEIGRREAVGLLVDKVVGTRAAELPPAAQAKLHEALQRLLDEDPTLAAQVGRVRGKD
ncbi:MAG: hypothetical protein IPG96_03615 [Proteobacteria bacterium]|nr:hypothetical protein [Pseudomonadota bacterium]